MITSPEVVAETNYVSALFVESNSNKLICMENHKIYKHKLKNGYTVFCRHCGSKNGIGDIVYLCDHQQIEKWAQTKQKPKQQQCKQCICRVCFFS